MHEEIIIEERFCGPPDSGNGGYVCGIVANYIGRTAEVRLYHPPPLARPLKIKMVGQNQAQLWDQDKLIAEGKPAKLELEIPTPPTWAEANAATSHYLGFREHPFPTCFVCGPKRTRGDGLQIFPGHLSSSNLVAAPWTPDASLGDPQGEVRREFLWAALDCPGAFSVLHDKFPPMVLGTLTAQLEGTVRTGEPCRVIGWEIGKEGKKHFVGTALFSEKGQLIAKAKAVWIDLIS